MAQITEDYVSFETAQLLKEKQFNEECFALYNPDGMLIQSGIRLNNIQVGRVKGSYSAPTLQMVMKWLRKEHKLCIVSIPVVTDDDGDGGCLWNYVILRKLNPLYESESLYESQETALNNAIKYCLENLL